MGGEQLCVHAHLLAHHSDYFLPLLNSQAAQNIPLQCDLLKYSKEAVDLFISWVYASSTKMDSYTEEGGRDVDSKYLRCPSLDGLKGYPEHY